MRRNAGDYVKSWGAALIRGAATNPEFMLEHIQPVTLIPTILKCRAHARLFR